MTAPQRIQLRRAKGWRLPEGAIIVSRPSPWGNPFVVGRDGTAAECVGFYTLLLCGFLHLTSDAGLAEQRELQAHVREHLPRLKGHDLACWCRPGQPCHADVLLRLASAWPAKLTLWPCADGVPRERILLYPPGFPAHG